MARKQHKYTSAETVTKNALRVEGYSVRRADGMIDVSWAIGDDGGASFVTHERGSAEVAVADLPAPVQAALDNLDGSLLTHLVGASLGAAGSQEDI
jgi:hypothetical protein